MYVYVVDAENRLVQRLIKVDAEIPSYFLISEGISDGEKILIEGLRKVHPGENVETRLLSTEELRASLKLRAE